MTHKIHRDYFKRETAEVATFVDTLKREAMTPAGVFDSAAAGDFISTAINQSTDVKVPNSLKVVLDEAGEYAPAITRAVLDGVNKYEEMHGVSAPADVVEQAFHSAYGTTQDARRKFALDSASSLHHDQLSLQPNRAVIAILTTIGEAIPFAHYLPADIGSNEAKLAIMSHKAGTAFGAYAQNDIMDGAASGNSYISSARVHTSAPDGATGNVSGKITKIQDTDETCDQAAGDLKLLRGRSLVYVGGRVAARETDASGTGNSPVSGTITVAGVSYAIGGTINTDTGVYALTTTPKLPTTVPVTVEGFIDFERDPTIVPSLISAVDTFQLFAKPWRVITRHTMDSQTQMTNELGLDPYSESVIAIQSQFANERHYEALLKGRRLAVNNVATFDYAAATPVHQDGRSLVWRDLAYPLGVVSQQMALDTLDHGVTHLYVTKRVAAQFLGMDNTIFQPSGITPRPGIYRIGRLFGQYDVYYTPKVLSETSTSAQILAVGRASNVTRNPIVLGDAVAPTVVPLSVGDDLRRGAGFYSRNFTAVNPHDQSSRGFALINVTNM